MKHVLITGGTDGLGKALAQKLVTAGYTVTILGQNEAKATLVAAELGCKFVVADVSKADQAAAAVKLAFEQQGVVDVLVNNAGVWIQDTLETNDDEAIRRVMDVNALGPIYMTKAVLPIMKRQGGGRIINVISQAGLNAKAERAVYNSSKWALTGFTESMQLELRPQRIAVTGFYPGALNTGLFEKAGNSRDMSRALDPAVAADSLMYVIGLPDSIEVPEIGIGSLKY